MKKLRENPVLLISSIVCLIVGMWLLTTDPNRVLNSIYFLIGGGLIVTGISKILMNKYSAENSYVYDGLVNIVIGVLLMFVHDLFISIILGILFVIFPLIRIYKSNDKKSTFRQELPLLLIGLVIALSGDLIGGIFVKIIGVVLLILAIYLFVGIFTGKIKFIKINNVHKSTSRKSRDNVIDVDYEEGNNG